MDWLNLSTASRQLLTILAVKYKTSVPPVVFMEDCYIDFLCFLYASFYHADHRYITVSPEVVGDGPEELLATLLHEFAHHRDIEQLPCDCRYPCKPELCEEKAREMEEKNKEYIELWMKLLGDEND